MLPLSVSTELTMHALMKQASQCFTSGRYKQSYELYIEALLSATKEFKRLEFINQYVKNHDLGQIFSLAEVCIKQARQIAAERKPRLNTNPSPPPIPPKPTHLTERKSPPQLPARPTQKKLHSFPQTTSKASVYHHSRLYSSSSEEDDDENSDIEDELDLIEEQRAKQKRATSDKSSGKFFVHRQKSTRRSSTTNLSTSAPPSPIHTAATNPFSVVKSFLSLPVTTHASLNEQGIAKKRGASFSSISSYLENTPLNQLDTEEVFLLTNSTIDPNQLYHAQTSDRLTNNKSGSTYLPMIPKAPLVVVYQSLQQKLKKEASEPSEFLQEENNMKTLLSKVQNIHISATTVPTILQFQPVLIAYQLTLIDSAIFRNIPLDAILSHGPKAPHPAIVASTDFFNYLTRLIEHSILTEQEACRRAQQINHWIKVAHRCDALKNYQTLKAIISALGTPPIERLKRSWAFIPKKSMSQLEALSELMSETDNYGRYREKIGLVAVSSLEDEIQTIKRRASPALSEPTVPFLGIFIHDMTYLIAANSKRNLPICHDLLKQDIRVAELLQLFRDLQRCPPYSPHLTEACLKELQKTKKRKLSQALSRNAIKKGNFYPSFDDSQFSIEMQQCLVTQYLLTRSWVSEKTVDELSLAREPTKTTRSHSATESLAFHQGKSISCENMSSSSQPPILTTSHSLTTTVRDSSGSLTSSESSNQSRPESMEEVIEKHEHESTSEKKPIPTGSFWLFGRKSVDQKSEIGMGAMQRSPRHFSFDELNDTKKHTKLPSNTISCPSDALRMHREGSQGSLSIFRKEFWKHQNNQQKIIDANPLPTLHPLDKMG